MARGKEKIFSSQPKGESKPTGNIKKAISLEGFVFLLILVLLFGWLGGQMGAIHMVNTMMNTAYDLLMNTVWYLLAIAVIAGALSELLLEFGFIAMLNKLLSPLIAVLFGHPGASVVGIFATYMSDNPAILTLANNKSFRRYYKLYQLPALTNIGTGFGMGLIVTAFMMGLASPTGESFVMAAVVGNIGAFLGTIVSTRLMLLVTKKLFGTDKEALEEEDGEAFDVINYRKTRPGNVGTRFIEALLDGGKAGVNMGFTIIPGVLVICTFVMILTNAAPAGGYTGAAYEGVGFLPMVGEKLEFLFKPLFGFASPSAIAVPVTALGSAGAALSLVPTLVNEGAAFANDIAVFTALCMCWSGYFSTHIAMMESLGFRHLAGKAILCHTIGGLVAGCSAHWIFVLLSQLL